MVNSVGFHVLLHMNMPTLLSPGLRFFAALLVSLFAAGIARGERLSITSTPAGATVEINGVPLGTTPFEKEYPGGYFHRTRTTFGARLEHPLIARLNLAGYATKEIVLTEGPMEWIGLNGRKHGEYWLFKGSHFEVVLDSITATFTGRVDARPAADSAVPAPELSLQVLAETTRPAIVQLKGLQKMATGFFVTDTGLIATNAHVARDEGSLLVQLDTGLQLEGSVVYLDPDLDIALVKVPGRGFRNLPLTAADTVQQGESVVALGNPADGLPFSMTRGIVSAVGKFPNAGPGTWVQTDTPINPGNSGGPLVNLKGEVVGMNTLKVIKKNVTGIGFALSAGDLLNVLSRFYEVSAPKGSAKNSLPAPANTTETNGHPPQ